MTRAQFASNSSNHNQGTVTSESELFPLFANKQTASLRGGERQRMKMKSEDKDRLAELISAGGYGDLLQAVLDIMQEEVKDLEERGMDFCVSSLGACIPALQGAVNKCRIKGE